MASAAEITVNLLELPKVRALVVACVALLKAEEAGADAYEVRHELAAIKTSLEAMGLRFPERHGAELWEPYVPGS